MRCVLAIAAAIGCTPARVDVTPAHVERAPARVAFGPLVLELVVDTRASKFHAVDQLSAWYPFHHVAYAALADPALAATEQAALADHRALRATHPWGRGLEAAYYLGDRAALDADALAREAAVLATLDARVAPFVAATQPHVEHFAAQVPAVLARETATLDGVGRLFATPAHAVPVVLVPRPGGGVGGGGANGGVLVVEVTRDELSLTPLVHELVHALLAHARPAIAAAAARCGIDAMTFEEAIAHAVAPGLVHDEPGDPLAAGGSPATARFYTLGMRVRPTLQAALSRGELATFLADACAAMSGA